MKNIKINTVACASVLAVAITLLSACALPHSEQVTGTTRPTLQVSGAAPDAFLYMDGVLIGQVGQYDGSKNVLKIEEGMHCVVIVKNGNVLHEEKIYASGGEKKRIEVGGAQ